MQVKHEDAPAYGDISATEDAVIQQALSILANRLHTPGAALTSPQTVRDFLRLSMAHHESEKFGIAFLDSAHRVIQFEILFTGTIDASSIWPREVVKAALKLNAAAVIYAHNHPSGNADPSQADRALTKRLKEALDLIDVRSLDHFVVGGSSDLEIKSMAEMGWM